VLEVRQTLESLNRQHDQQPARVVGCVVCSNEHYHNMIGDKMTTATKARRPRREVTESNLPLNAAGTLDLVAILVVALTVPGRISNCYNKFYKYSFLNMVLVLMQTGILEPIANFKKWQSLGRTVVSGPGSALFVNHPRFAPRKDPNTGKVIVKNGKAEMKFIGAYPKASVWQLFQTDGPDLDLSGENLPDWDREQAMAELDITEGKFAKINGNISGYSHDRVFALNPANCPAPFKTMIHEWAHILLGHTDGGYAEHPRDIAEFQAESVAYLVCHELDVEAFDASYSRGYIQTWLAGKTTNYLDDNGDLLVTDEIVRNIFSITDRILVAGRKAHYDKLVEPALF
jgi:hypothetical protein